MKKFWKFILTIIIAVAAYGYEAYDFGAEAHEAISLLQGQLEVKLLELYGCRNRVNDPVRLSGNGNGHYGSVL